MQEKEIGADRINYVACFMQPMNSILYLIG